MKLLRRIFYRCADGAGLRRLHRRRSVRPHYRPVDADVPWTVVEPDVPELRLTEEGRRDGRRFGRFLFDSAIRTAYPENNRVGGLFWEPDSKESGGRLRTCAVVLHGWRMNRPDRVEKLVVRGLLERGVGVYAPYLPYHFSRAPAESAYGGEYMISADLPRTVEAVAQAVADVRALVRWLRRCRGAAKVALIGVSLGGQIANLTAAFEPELDALVSVFAPNSLAHAVWHTRPGVYIRRELEANGVHYGVLAEAWRDLDPARYRPALAKERILLMSAAYDRYVDLADAEALWRAWGEPARIVYPCGHAGLVLERRRIGREVARFLRLEIGG